MYNKKKIQWRDTLNVKSWISQQKISVKKVNIIENFLCLFITIYKKHLQHQNKVYNNKLII
jgi:hypothetical protein